MEDDIITLAAVFFLLATAIKLIKKRKKLNKSVWTRLWVQKRAVHGAHNAQLHELYPEDHSALKKKCRDG